MSTGGQVSVALASFNGARYIAQQLRSILDQTRPPDEVVISDGGSEDETVKVARDVLAGAAKDIRVEVIADGARLGVAENFERAISATRGEFIALSDQDDRWHPDRLARGLGLVQQPDVLLAAGNANLVAADGRDQGVDLFTALGVGPVELAALEGSGAFPLLLRRNLVTGATVMFRRPLLEVATPFPSDWVHDEWLAILATAFGRVGIDTTPLIDYRQHAGNEIGVRVPTLRYRIGRMLEPRGDRYRVLARRSKELADRLSERAAPLEYRDLAARKVAFESVRASYGVHRISRLRPVLSGVRAGSYRDLSSQGTLDVARDLLQPR
jgi:glycosyltransferase involved in cell wall biosynthesis